MTRVIEIVYMPGYAGNFCVALLSLDPEFDPYHIKKPNNDSALQRAKTYLDLGQIRHLGDFNPYEFNDSDNSRFREIHPHEFQINDHRDICVIVDLDWSDFNNFWLMSRKQDHDYQIARVRTGEAARNNWIHCHLSDCHINLGALITQECWQHEYVRVCDALGIRTHCEEAEMLWHWWYDHQVARYRQTFAGITPEQTAYWCRQRLLEEEWGTHTVWQVFYSRVRDPSWPDCDNEDDFAALPKAIRQEIIEVHGYRPGKSI